MTDLRQAAQQALEALEGWEHCDKWVWPVTALEQAKRNTTESLAALRTALEQQAEPVALKCGAIIEVFDKDWRMEYLSLPVGKHKLYTQQYIYTAPPQRQWVGLTDEEITEIYEMGLGVRASIETALDKIEERNT